jgi:hypothetical protein
VKKSASLVVVLHARHQAIRIVEGHLDRRGILSSSAFADDDRLDAAKAPLERFRAKWTPVRVKKTRQTKNLERRF